MLASGLPMNAILLDGQIKNLEYSSSSICTRFRVNELLFNLNKCLFLWMKLFCLCMAIVTASLARCMISWNFWMSNVWKAAHRVSYLGSCKFRSSHFLHYTCPEFSGEAEFQGWRRKSWEADLDWVLIPFYDLSKCPGEVSSSLCLSSYLF